jgi:ubiquinone/menaquinone biosynthesis C-methylase UbiE
VSTFERFAEYFDLVSHAFVNYVKDCDALEGVFEAHLKKRPRSILDVACGTGSHALILSQRGYEVTGIDNSRAMIEKAIKKAGEKKETRADFLIQDMRNINMDKKKFDCAICMFGGFSYMLTQEDLTGLFTG